MQQEVEVVVAEEEDQTTAHADHEHPPVRAGVVHNDASCAHPIKMFLNFSLLWEWNPVDFCKPYAQAMNALVLMFTVTGWSLFHR